MTAKEKLNGFTAAMEAKGFTISRSLVWGRPGCPLCPATARIEYAGPAGEFFAIEINDRGEAAPMQSPMTSEFISAREKENRMDNTTSELSRRKAFGLV